MGLEPGPFLAAKSVPFLVPNLVPKIGTNERIPSLDCPRDGSENGTRMVPKMGPGWLQKLDQDLYILDRRDVQHIVGEAP